MQGGHEMKAKNKKTGEIIDVDLHLDAKDGYMYERQVGKDRWLVYKEEDLDFNDLTDWSTFRREAAKDIMCAVLSVPGLWEETKYDGLAAACIKQADELIRQLKQE